MSDALWIGLGIGAALAYVGRNEIKFRQLEEARERLAALEKAQEKHDESDERRFAALERGGQA